MTEGLVDLGTRGMGEVPVPERSRKVKLKRGNDETENRSLSVAKRAIEYEKPGSPSVAEGQTFQN